MSQPTIAAAVLAALTEAAPSRLVRKLDKSPTMAEAWSWKSEGQSWSITTDGGETVSLSPDERGVIVDEAHVSCTCLLAPRCLHILAVVSSLNVSEASIEEEEAPQTDEASIVGVEVTEETGRAASALLRASSMLVEGGAIAAGAVVQAELLRAIHEGRAQGLHRAAAAGLRVLRAVRDLRAEKPEFTVEALTNDLHQTLMTAYRLGESQPGAVIDQEWIGTARRAYRKVGGGLKLCGLFTEPIIAGSGYAGVVTSLCDARGRIVTVSDVMPGEPPRARSTYDAALRLGEATISHRELSRRGLFLQDATVSADGRLGAGGEVKAVARGVSGWNDPEVAHLWDTPLADQLQRARDALARPVTERPAGSDLIFIRGVVAGLEKDGLVMKAQATEGGPWVVLCARVPLDHEVLTYRDNARQLGRAPGLEVMAIGRVRLSRPRTVDLLALGPLPTSGDSIEGDGPALRLPAAWGGRVNLGLDAIQGGHLSGARRDAHVVDVSEEEMVDPLEPLRRRLQRLALGGRATIPSSALRAMHREAAALEAAMMPTAAAMMVWLGQAATGAERLLDGTRSAGDPEQLAAAWLAACTYERVATLELHYQSWI